MQSDFYIILYYYIICYSTVNGKMGLLNQYCKVANITIPKDQYIAVHYGCYCC